MIARAAAAIGMAVVLGVSQPAAEQRSATVSQPADALEQRNGPQPFDWEYEIRSDDADFDLQAVTAGRGGDGVWVLVGSRPKGRLSSPDRFFLWHLDNSGAPILHVDVGAAVRTVGAPHLSVDAISAIDGNRIAVVLSTVKPVLAIFDGQTGQLVRESILPSTGELVISKAISMSDGNLLLLGHARAYGWLASVDEFGRTIWEKRLSSEGVAHVLDGAPSGRDEFVLLGSANSTAADPITWVGRVTARGQVIVQTRVHGEVDAVAGGADGTTLLVGGRPAAGARGKKDIWIQLLTAGLAEKRTTTIVSSVPSILPLTSASLPGGGWMITGTSPERLPWFGRVTAGGELQWSDVRRYDPKSIPIVGRSVVVSNAGQRFAVFDLWIVDARAEQRMTVRILKLTPQ